MKIYKLIEDSKVNHAKRTICTASSCSHSLRITYWYCSKKQEETDGDELDLHGFRRSEAIEEFKQFLRYHRELKKYEYLTIITGWGKNSPNNRPVIKPAIIKYLRTMEPHIKMYHENRGCLVLYNYY